MSESVEFCTSAAQLFLRSRFHAYTCTIEVTAQAIEAGILRVAFVIIGFLWGVWIVQTNKDAAPKAVGMVNMVVFFLMGFWFAK